VNTSSPTTHEHTEQSRQRATLDHGACYDAVRRRDRRFDGVFFTGVTSTGIFCRPSCPARTPASANVVFFRHAAAAGDAGFRPCRRCRPELAPGHPEWNRRADLTGRALAMIGAGQADALGVAGLARRLGVSERHLRRELQAEVGVGPAQLMQNRRLSTARLLLDQTDLAVTDVAFAAGFGSIRRFNEAFRHAFDLTPTEVRRPGRQLGQEITLTLPGRSRLAWAGLHRFLASRAIPGLETTEVYQPTDGGPAYGRYRRGVEHGWFELEAPLVADDERPGSASSELTMRCSLDGLEQLGLVVAQVRALADLDTDRQAVSDSLADTDPLLEQRIGLLPDGLPALPTGLDPFEVAVRAVLGQQVSVAGAATTLGRLLDIVGPAPATDDDPATATDAGGETAHRQPLRCGFPTAADVAGASLEQLGIPQRRRQTLRALSEAVADGGIDLSPAADREQTLDALLALPGIGPWTAGYIAMRALSDPDGWPSGDLVLRKSLAAATGGDVSSTELDQRAERWRPWRAYAAMALWATSNSARTERQTT
jgi:AraC family transcriptional regulator of adaptative response / DNA-3-methyladenine glycosylase II